MKLFYVLYEFSKSRDLDKTHAVGSLGKMLFINKRYQ